MILNHFSKINLYEGIIPQFDKVSEILRSDWSQYTPGRNDISGDDVYVIKVEDEQDKASSGLLEVHQLYWDVHVTIAGVDVVHYKKLDDCSQLHKAYNLKDDYALYADEKEAEVSIPENYFCVIDPSIAHMALEGKGSITKLIIKVKCN